MIKKMNYIAENKENIENLTQETIVDENMQNPKKPKNVHNYIIPSKAQEIINKLNINN